MPTNPIVHPFHPKTMTSQSRARALTMLNLTAIFGEKNPTTRLESIEELWVPSGECFFVDPNGVCKTHEEISDVIAGIQASGTEKDYFFKIAEGEKKSEGEHQAGSSVVFLAHDASTDTWITKVRWGVGEKQDEPKLAGSDVLTIVGGRIKACYTFLDG